MTSTERGTIGEILLKKRSSTSVRFDIMVSSFIAGLMIPTLPDGIIGQVLFICAVGLALTGIVRWLGVTGRFANEEVILSRTYRLLEFLTIVGVFHLVNTAIDQSLMEFFPQIGQPILTSFGAVTLTLIGIIGIEFIQWNYRLWWGTVFFVRALNLKQQKKDADEPFNQLYGVLANLWAMVAFFLLQNAIPEGDEPGLNDLRGFVDNASKRFRGGEVSSGIARLMIVLTLLIIPSFAVIAWILSWVLGPITDLFAVLIGVWSLQHVINFYYMSNGTLTLERWLQTNKLSVLTRFSYTGIIYLLFFML